VDEYQGQRVGTALLRHLVLIARASGLRQLVAEVLPENAPMLALFRKFGFTSAKRGGDAAVHLTLNLST
jgi:ribosomal protein S18 acetylase RimI-like enzyme